MADQTTHVTVGVKLDVDGLDLAERLRKSLRGLQTQLTKAARPSIAKSFIDPRLKRVAGDLNKTAQAWQRQASAAARYGRNLNLNTRLLNQHARAQSRADAAALRAFRERLSFGTRMARQRASEERAERRLHERRMTRIERERSASRRLMLSRAHDAFHGLKDSGARIARGTGYAMAGTAAVTGLAAKRIMSAEVEVDSATVNAQIYGGLSKQAAQALRNQWAAPLSENLGSTTTELLKSYSEGLKLGIPEEGARAFAELSTKVSEAWDIDVAGVSDALGGVNAVLTAAGQAFDFKKLYSVANAIQHLSAKTAASPTQLNSFLKRGSGAAALLKMSQEAALAFGAASVSLGNEAGESGTLLDFVAKRLVADLPKLVKQKGDEGDQARQIIKDLGFRNFAALDQARRANPDDFVFDLFERLDRIKDTTKRERHIAFLAQGQWIGEMGRLIEGSASLRNAQALAKESRQIDAIGQVWELHKAKLLFTAKTLRAGFQNLMGEFGQAFSPMAQEAASYFLRWAQGLRASGLQSHFRAALDGFVRGLAPDAVNLTEALQQLFGKPGSIDLGSLDTWRAHGASFAAGIRAFGQGLKDVKGLLVSAFAAFGGGNLNTEELARWAGRIIALAALGVILLPLSAAFSSVAIGLMALGKGVGAAYKGLKLLGRSNLLRGALSGLSGLATRFPAAARAILSRLAGFAARGLLAVFSGPLLWAWIGLEVARAIYRNWETVKTKLLPALKDSMGKLWAFVSERTRELFDGAASAFMSGMSAIGNALADAVTNMLDNLKQRIQNYFAPSLEQAAGGMSTGAQSNPFLNRSGFQRLFGKTPSGTSFDPNDLTPALEWPKPPEILKDFTGQNGILGGIGFDNLTGSRSLGYQSATAHHLERMNGKFDQLIRLFTFDDVGRAGGGSAGDASSGLNGHLRRPSRALLSRSSRDNGTASFLDKTGALRPRSPNQHLRRLRGLSGAFSGGLTGGGFGGDPYSSAITSRLASAFDRNSPMAQRRAQLMRVAMDQLRKEGVPEQNLKEAAANLVGQAQSESGLDPTKTHDGGTGYGLYGARDPQPGRGRKTAMLKWMAANGYAKDSAEGQMRYMAKEAMSGAYPKTAAILKSGRTDPAAVNTITGEFERPKVINNRSPAVQAALGADLNAASPQQTIRQNIEGLKLKSVEAISGGPTASQIFDVARYLQNNTPGGVKHFAAFNDAFHQRNRPYSWHTRGMAGDATFNDPSQYKVMAQKLREQFTAAGLGEKEFEVIDHHARGDAPPHLHWAFKGEKAAAKYERFIERQKALADALKPKAPLQPQQNSIELQKPQTPDALIRDLPNANGSGGNRTNTNNIGGPQTNIHIHGSGQDHHQLAAAVQRRISEVWTRRTNDLETDIA